MRPLIQAEGVSKKFCRSLPRSMRYGLLDVGRDMIGLPLFSGSLRTDEFWSLDSVSFEVWPGECLGVIGHNGAGKSTLLKLLAGIFPPDLGCIRVRGRTGSLIEVGAGFHPMLSGRENVFINGAILGMSTREIDANFDAIVDFSGLQDFIDSPVKHYSSGMYVRLGFAVAVYSNPDVLLVDEALAVGDAPFRIKCLNRIAKMRREGTGIVFVSHSETQVREVADRCLLINHGKADLFERVDKAFEAYRDQAVEEESADHSSSLTDYASDLELLGVDLFASTGENRLETGAPLSMRVRYRAWRKLHRVHFVLRLWNGYGQLVATLDSRDEGVQFNLIDGEGVVNIQIPGVPLVAGRYRLAGGFCQDGTILAWSTGLATLSMRSPRGEATPEGFLVLKADYDQQDAPQAVGEREA